MKLRKILVISMRTSALGPIACGSFTTASKFWYDPNENDGKAFLLTPAELEAVRRETWEAARQKDVTAIYADSNRQSEFVMRYVCFEEWLATLEAK